MKNTMLLSALAALAAEPESGAAQSGIVYSANESLLEAALKRGAAQGANDGNVDGFHLSEPLTQFITTVPDPENLQALLDSLFPNVPTGMRFSYAQWDESSAFQKDSMGEITRPVGGEFAVVSQRATEAEGRCYNKGLTIYVDNDQGGMLPQVQQQHVASLRNRILRSELAQGVALIDAAAGEEGSTNWGSSTSNPDGDVRTSLKNAGDLRGIESNVVLFGQGSWNNRCAAYEQAGRTNGGMKADYTPERLAQLLGVDRVVNLKTRYRTSATALAGIIGSTVYNYYAQFGATTTDPSNVKRFTMNTPSGQMRVFIEQQTSRVKITVDMYSNIIVTSTVGIRKRTVTYS
ncbi:MAG: hypothetical protein V4662_25000 [Verrucomicrobiota bacterium]